MITSKHISDYLYINKSDNKFVYASSIKPIIKELSNLLDEHYHNICHNILKLKTVKLVAITDSNYNVLYGLYKSYNDLEKILTYINILHNQKHIVLAYEYFNIKIYNKCLVIELESGYKLLIMTNSLKHINVIKSLIISFL